MTTRAHKTSKRFQHYCRPWYVQEKFVRMLMRVGLTRKGAYAHLQKIREEASAGKAGG